MKITSLKIERFGVWEGLNLPKVSRGLNVFYGPNEAGKTTLMQFIRTCLYGGADEERARYVQMALDGKGRRFAALSALDVSGKGGESAQEKNKNGGSDDGSFELRPEVKRILDAAKEADAVKEALDAKTTARDSARSWIGGSATVSSEFGEHRLERRYIRRDSSWQTAVERKSGFLASEGLINWSGRFYSLPGQKIAESLVVTGPDGARVGDYFAKSLTCNLDEATYNGVFAIGLDELQRLGMLNETEAAQMLYRLSVGVDRGAFVQVFQQIVAERNDLFDVKGKPSIVENLLAERDRARRKSNDSAANLREYARLLEERRAVLEATKNLQERLEKATRQKRLRELAVQIAPVWDERDSVRDEIDAMGKVPRVEQSSVDECKSLIAAVDETAAKIKKIKASYRAFRDERDSIEIDPALDELSPRVAILESDLPRLREIDDEVGSLREELGDLSAKLSEEEARVKSARDGKLVLTPNALDAVNATLAAMKMVPGARFSDANAKKSGVSGIGGFDKTGSLATNAGNAPILPNKLAEEGIPFKEVEDFKIPARAVRRRRLKLAKYREELERVRAALAELVEKLEQGLTSRRQKNLTEAIERTGALLSGLRRRIEIERRVGEMSQYRKELERQNKTLVENQSITGGPLYALGAGVVVGGLLFGLSLFGKMELAVGLLGLLALIACVFYKTTVEKKNFQKLEDNQRRLGLLTKQLEQAQAEAKTLDERFPAPANSTATFENRLQKAKADLTFFESLAPVEAKWRETTKVFRSEEVRVQKAEEALKKARKRWIAWLRDAYLPTTLNATQVRDLLARVGLTEDLRRQIDGVQAEIDYLLRERQGILDRLSAAVALLPKLDLQGKTPTPFELVPVLRDKLDEHSETLRKRAELSDEMAALKKEYRRLFLQRRAQARAVRKFLAGYRVKTLETLVGCVDRYSTFLRKSAELDAAQKRLDVGIGGFCPEEELGALLLDAEIRAELPTAIENLTKRLEALDAELRGKLELSGRLGQQADAIAAKKESVRSRFDAAALDLRIAEMTDLWQSRAVAGKILEDVRRAYERERQPETLREASRYLRRLTENRYVNIWTPLGEDALFVDSAEGETLDVAALSRGTREQLFIAIRLALVVSFEKHGIQMPLVLDDVLVNFDVRRAATAAKLLCEFVKGGRQIFLFTCHEHICRLFLSLRVPVCVLPSSNEANRGFRVLLPPKPKAKARKNAASNVSIGAAPVVGPTLAADPQRFDAPTPYEIVEKTEKKAADSQVSDSRPSVASKAGSEPASNDDEKSRKRYLVVDGSDEAQGLRLSEEAESLNAEKAALPWNLSVAADAISNAVETIDPIAPTDRVASDVGSDDSQNDVETTSGDSASVDSGDSTAPSADADSQNVAKNDWESEVESENEVESDEGDFSKYVFSSEPSPFDVSSEEDKRGEIATSPSVEYVETLKNASLDGENVELRALSEISSTFSTAESTVPTETAENPGDFEFAVENAVAPVDVQEATESPETFDVDAENAAVANVAVSEDAAAEDDENDEENDDSDSDSLDDLDSLDYDEWATVFLADSESNPLSIPKNEEKSDVSFLDYFDENDGGASDEEEDEESEEDEETFENEDSDLNSEDEDGESDE